MPLFLITLLAGCPESEKEDDTSGADDTAAADSAAEETDTRPDETGVSGLYWLASFETADSALVSAELGFGAYGLRDEDWVCTVMGTLAYEGPAPDGCPGCDWAFDLGPVENGVLDGTRCEAFGAYGETIFSDAASLDGYFDWSWGFGSAYTYYGADGTPYPLEETLFVNTDGTSWGLFAFNYDTSFVMIDGDAEALSVVAEASDGAGAFIYYYYYL